MRRSSSAGGSGKHPCLVLLPQTGKDSDKHAGTITTTTATERQLAQLRWELQLAARTIPTGQVQHLQRARPLHVTPRQFNLDWTLHLGLVVHVCHICFEQANDTPKTSSSRMNDNLVPVEVSKDAGRKSNQISQQPTAVNGARTLRKNLHSNDIAIQKHTQKATGTDRGKGPRSGKQARGEGNVMSPARPAASPRLA